jgi:Histidine phosphatase superfamily (branch 2)
VCSPEYSHHWGQYSPYFSVPSNNSTEVPHRCKVSFAQLLSRHGARDPTASKTATYAALISSLKSKVKTFSGEYGFLANYTYTLGADQLTTFGQQEMVNSGIKFYERYEDLIKRSKYAPFVRSSSETRVLESAQNWTQGFHQAMRGDSAWLYPYAILVLSEADGSNNTLNHGLCTAFESGPNSKIGSSSQSQWVNLFVPPIQTRLNNDLPGANFSKTDVINFMDLCPFNTVAATNGSPLSPFCRLFNQTEWEQYDYCQSLGKYYGYGPGNQLGPTQGVGFVNELIARLTNSQVNDSTSTNHTLDSNQDTFPTDNAHTLFADFSHDNDIMAILGALGLYSSVAPLSNTTITTAQQSGYSAAWTVPFAARVYIEKLTCLHDDEDLVRIVVNDRVVPLANCETDEHGTCKLSDFVDGLTFARNGGRWGECFV